MRYQRSLATLLLFILISSCAPMEKDPNSQPISTGTSIITLTVPPTATLTSTSTPTPTLVPMSDFMSGMTFSTGSGFYYGFENPIGEDQLANVVKPMGVTWIALMFPCSMSSIDSPIITCDTSAGTPSDQAIKHIILYAKSLGLRVLLKPFLSITSGGFACWVKMKSEADWQLFFENYTKSIVHFAELANETGVDYFSVGTELDNTQFREADWRKVIQTVRTIYSGPLTYGADPYGNETSITWWDALDAIGVDAYYPLTNLKNPTIEQLKSAWLPHVSLLETLSKKWDRPIIFTEAGYTTEDGTNVHAGEKYDQPIDLQEQADCYQALIETFRDKPWWKGVFWFQQSVMPSEGGPAGQFFEINGKPAENVLRAFNGQPPFPTPTPIQNYDSENNQHLEIYSDQLGKIWELPAVFTWMDIASTDQVFNGRYSLKVLFNPWGFITFRTDPALELSGYDFLEFYIYIEKIKNEYYPNINVAFNDADGVLMLAMPDVMRPGYVEDGELTLHQWHRVRIPLAELGAVNQKITSLMFTHQSEVGSVEFYLDNISLVKYNQLYGTPQPTSTPIIYPDASLPTTEVIYGDQLSPNWNNYPPEGDPANIQFDQSDIVVDGNAIKIKLLNFSPLDLRNDKVDWKKSQWLEFDLQVESKNLPDRYGLNVFLRDALYQSSPGKVNLLGSQFIEGGKIQPGSWQHVQIPLDVFGSSLGDYVMISIERPGHGSETPLMVYVDNVILRGK